MCLAGDMMLICSLDSGVKTAYLGQEIIKKTNSHSSIIRIPEELGEKSYLSEWTQGFFSFAVNWH